MPAPEAGDRPRTAPHIREAVALQYRPDDMAPRVVAKGQGLIAEEIIRRANAAGVYVHQSGDLVGMLMGLDLDAHIPPRLYLVVAELLAWLRRTEQGHAERPDAPAAHGAPPAK